MRGSSFVGAVAGLLFVALLSTEARQDPSATLAGRLATVEPANRRVTVVPEGEVDLVELFVSAEGQVAEDSRTLTLADLVIQVGRRVTVQYRTDGGRRIADRIIVEPD
jgi:hypothetical protein